jgi:hypothetical protein
MGYTLQMLRALIEAHPDRAERLAPHVEALELSIQSQPAFCLQNVRTLFEAAHATIAPQLGVAFASRAGFPDRMRGVIDALDFSIVDHPEAAAIHTHVQALVAAINDMAVALARLSNVPNMRHGGSLDWGTLERQHATMLGGLCDTLVSFLFDVAWNRPGIPNAEGATATFDDYADFNEWLDEESEEVEVAGSHFRPSQVLYLLDATKYEAARIEWSAQAAEEDGADEEAA